MYVSKEVRPWSIIFLWIWTDDKLLYDISIPISHNCKISDDIANLNASLCNTTAILEGYAVIDNEWLSPSESR